MNSSDIKTIVFFLGAGASKHLGLPVMREFFDEARRRRRDDQYSLDILGAFDDGEALLPKCYARLVEFHRRYRGVERDLGIDWDNIEELYTQANLCRLLRRPNPEQAGKVCQAIEWCTWDVYRRLDHNKLDMEYRMWEICNNVFNTNIVSNLPRYVPVVITTNYDLAVELSLIRAQRRKPKFYYPGFSHTADEEFCVTIDEPDSLTTKEWHYEVPLLKLHGSVNWFDCGEDWVSWSEPRHVERLSNDSNCPNFAEISSAVLASECWELSREAGDSRSDPC